MVVSAVVLGLGLTFMMGILYHHFGAQIGKELEKEASYLAGGVLEQGIQYLEKIKNQDSRITYIQEDGKVLYDSEAEASGMENHLDREEVQEALSRGVGRASRMSATLSEKTTYYALRLDNGNILRVSSTQFSLLTLILELIQPMLWVVLVMMILSGFFAARIAGKIVEPINQLDLEHPEENQIYEEISPLLSRMYKQNRLIAKQLETAGRQQEEFSIITENMQEGLLVIDRYTMILSGNSSAWKLFKVKSPRNGESVYSLSRNEEFRGIIGRVLAGEHKEVTMKIDGEDVQLIANPVTREGDVEGAVLLLMNVTERVERENLRREFSANVSHELKTPLTSISGIAEIIQDGYVKEEDIKTFAGRIYREAQRLISLVQDVIKISQLDEGEIPYEWTEVDLYAMSKEVFGNLKDEAKKQNVHLYIGGTAAVRTVPPILEEVLHNLCENGVKYNKNDGTVSILLEEKPEEVTITVKDTGIGIPREDQSRIFERFYRVDKSHSKEIGGTGLGLSIVKHGVTFLGGTISVESELGMGTAITVTLPKEKRPEGENQAA
ncbi:MAG: ATP-binding protein [Eubacteriales bacterium]|nr:ATP-binding protein [Eubacteriales bacterium]